jgi:membrane protein
MGEAPTCEAGMKRTDEQQEALTPRKSLVQVLKDRVLRAVNKFNNDWTMNLVGMLAYSVLTSFLALLLALLTFLTLLPGILASPEAFAQQIDVILPENVQQQVDVVGLLHAVNSHAGLLALISIGGLLWGGSNLFGSIECAFALIFRVKTRAFVPQKVMSLLMILLFVLLLPISFFSSFLLNAASTGLGKILPPATTTLVAQAVAALTSIIALFVLFLAIYVVVPNIPIRWRYAWRGTVVATLGMYLCNTLFPWYTAHFINTDQYGVAALAGSITLIVWFWFFSLILLVGAQLNALTIGIGFWRFDLSRTLMEYQIPTEGGAPTALEALRAKGDPVLLESPFGLARDAQVVSARPSAPGSGEAEKP